MLKSSDRKKDFIIDSLKLQKKSKNFILVEKSHYTRFSHICKPFCYEQTSPLEVLLYTFGFSLSVLKHFSLSPNEGDVKKVQTAKKIL